MSGQYPQGGPPPPNYGGYASQGGNPYYAQQQPQQQGYYQPQAPYYQNQAPPSTAPLPPQAQYPPVYPEKYQGQHGSSSSNSTHQLHHHQGGSHGGAGNLSSNSADKINSKPKYNDVWATILFVLVTVAFAILAYFGIAYIRVNLDKFSAQLQSNLAPILVSIGIAIVGGLILSTLYLLLMQRFAGKMIIGSGIIMILLNVGMSLFLIFSRQYINGIILLLFSLLYAWLFYSWRHRIPFAKVMLKTVTRVTGQYPATLLAGFLGLILEMGFLVLWILTLAGWVVMNVDAKVSNGVIAFMGVYLAFSFYWISSVIQNTVHVTVSGLFASFYFLGVPDQSKPGRVTLAVRNPTAKSAGRALTTSFGSICYGSLIIALIQTLRTIVRSAAQSSAQDGNLCAVFCLYCLDCFLSMIEALAQYFNKYAFTQVAIYGKDYCTAGKDTWQLLKARGIDAIINDDLIGNVLGLGTFITGLITGGSAALYIRYADTSYSNDVGAVAILGVIAFFIGMVEFAIMAEVINSGVAATFVCLAEDPAALHRTKPELFDKIAAVYPQVLAPI